MKLNQNPHIIFLLLLACFNVHASGLPEKTLAEKSEIAFRYQPGKTTTLNNYFVKEIARYNFLNLYTTAYTIDFVIDVKFTQNNSGEYTLTAALRDTKLKGDIYYKAFDLTEVLMPSAFGFELYIHERKDTVRLNFDALHLSGENTLAFVNHALAGFDDPGISLSKVTFNYLESDRSKFNTRISLINQFLAFREMLSMNIEKSGTINPNTRDSVLPVFMQIWDIARFKTALENYDPKFPVPEDFQAEMLKNQNKLNANLRRINTLFQRNTDTLQNRIDEKQMNAAADILIALQKEYLAAMQTTNHLFEPAYISIADFFGEQEGWPELAENLDKSLLDTKLGDRFVSILYQRYSAECDSLIANEYFNEAEIFASNAKTFCDIRPEDDCEIKTFNKLAQTKYGIFDAYMRVSGSAMENNNLPFSLKYVRLAEDFQQQNSSFIISPAAVNQFMEQLAWKYLEAGENLYDQKDFVKALDHYVTAQDLYEELGISQYAELIDKRIGQCLKADAEDFSQEE